MSLLTSINNATLTQPVPEIVIEKIDVTVNNGRIDCVVDDRRKAISSDLTVEEKTILPQRRAQTSTTAVSTSTTTSTTTTSTGSYNPYARQATPAVVLSDEEKIKKTLSEIKDSVKKEVAQERKSISASIVPASNKFLPAKNKKEESAIITDIKIIGLETGCAMIEKLVRDSILNTRRII